MKRTYIVVEGPHDVAFVARLLHPHGFQYVRKLKELDAAWDEPLIPKRFPHGDDLLKRVPVPTFIQSATHSVALHSAEGITNIVKMFEESWVALLGTDDHAALGLNGKDLKDFRKPAGARKATLATVASVLRPGKAIAVAIQDGRWLDPAALGRLSRLATIQAFLAGLLGLDNPPGAPAAPRADESP